MTHQCLGQFHNPLLRSLLDDVRNIVHLSFDIPAADGRNSSDKLLKSSKLGVGNFVQHFFELGGVGI
jgi:hypothetical protein